MSTATAKSIILSQPKVGQSDVTPTVTLPHTIDHGSDLSLVNVEIPGIDPSTVNVNFDNYVLHVECERGELRVPVDPTVDITKVKADIQWGLLTLRIPAPSLPASRTIRVNIHDTQKG